EGFLRLEGGGRRHSSHLSRAGSTVTDAAGAGCRPTSAASYVLTFAPELRQAKWPRLTSASTFLQPGVPVGQTITGFDRHGHDLGGPVEATCVAVECF